jgi:hypothetical protein
MLLCEAGATDSAAPSRLSIEASIFVNPVALVVTEIIESAFLTSSSRS